MMRKISLSLVMLTAVLGVQVLAAAEVAYYRWPSIYQDRIVFTAEGDLWSVPASGGDAQRLTTHPAEESEARISPDGRWIAFIGSYDSAAEVYVMPIQGGEPRRLSFDGGRAHVQGWTADNAVLYSSDNVSGPANRRVLRIVDPQTRVTRQLPLQDVHEAAFSADGKTLFFVRFGLQLTTDNARGYRGGAMAQLWSFDLDGRNEARRLLPEVNANLSRPMVWADRLYFVSDEDGIQNVWSMRFDGSDRQQLTQHKQFDVRTATVGDGSIVYQHGADLRRFNIADRQDHLLSVRVVSDFEQKRQRWLREAMTWFTGMAVAADGSAVTLTARGKVVVAAPGPLRRRQIAIPDAHRARSAVPSVDGQYVYAISDIDGDQEIWRFPADGSDQAKQLTKDGGVHRWRLYPSPDGHWLAHDNKRGQLWLLNLDSGVNEQIDAGNLNGDDVYASVVWSPDSQRLALVRAQGARQINQVHVFELATRQLSTLGSDRYESFEPAFSRDGHWLYFLSDRNFEATPGAPWGDRNMGPMFNRRTQVFAYALQAGQRFGFAADNELSVATKPESDPKSTRDSSAVKAAQPARLPAIEWDGIESRLFQVPIDPGNYQRLAVHAERLYLLDVDSGAKAKPQLLSLAINKLQPKPEVFAKDVRDFQFSADGQHILYMKWKDEGAGDLFIVDATAKAADDTSKQQVRLNDWVLPIAPELEWRQMFVDAWRMHRDFAFDPNMRGLDWDAVRARYEPILSRVSDRAELDDLLAQMTSELGILHSQVRGAEFRKDEKAAVAASLGAVFSPVAGGLRIDAIYRSEPELPSARGPLQQPGIDVRIGDVLNAINGRATVDQAALADALHNQAGQQVLLDLRRGDQKLKQVVVPTSIDGDAALRYSDWVQQTRDQVQKVGNGRIGYLHLRAMTSGDIAGFARDFYANYDRDGLIIDVRRNRGGNIDSWVIEKLLRRTWAFWKTRETPVSWNMQQGFRGHLAVLIDPLTYSDGETFAAGIKSLGLGPLIGQQTAGAGIWLSDRNRLSDGGLARVAETGQFRADGQWLIEGRGVSPDIAVENLPMESAAGRDRQLQTALDYLARRLEEKPLSTPEAQAIPSRGTTANDAVKID